MISIDDLVVLIDEVKKADVGQIRAIEWITGKATVSIGDTCGGHYYDFKSLDDIKDFKEEATKYK